MADEITTTSTADGGDKGATAPATAGQPMATPEGVPPALEGAAPSNGDAGGGEPPAPAPSTPESLADLLGEKIEPPKPNGQEPAPDFLKALIAERDELRAKAAQAEERKGYRALIDKTVAGLDEATYDRDEIRGQLEMSVPIYNALLQEAIAPLVQRLEAAEQAVAGEAQRRRQQAFAQSRESVNNWVRELGQLTGSGIENFIGPQLDQMVGLYAAKFGLQPESAMDSDEGYKYFVKMIESDIRLARARKAKAATAQRETAEARTVPGGRSPHSPTRSVTLADIEGKPKAERDRILREARGR